MFKEAPNIFLLKARGTFQVLTTQKKVYLMDLKIKRKNILKNSFNIKKNSGSNEPCQ